MIRCVHTSHTEFIATPQQYHMIAKCRRRDDTKVECEQKRMKNISAMGQAEFILLPGFLSPYYPAQIGGLRYFHDHLSVQNVS